MSLVLLVFLAGALLAVNAGLRGSPGRPGAVSAPGRPPASEPAEAGTASAAAPRGGQRLVVRAIEPTWLKVQMDGGSSVQELLPAGATREWTAERRFLLTVGNAGGLRLELNGQTLPPLGERGAVIRELVLPQGAPAGGS